MSEICFVCAKPLTKEGVTTIGIQIVLSEEQKIGICPSCCKRASEFCCVDEGEMPV